MCGIAGWYARVVEFSNRPPPQFERRWLREKRVKQPCMACFGIPSAMMLHEQCVARRPTA